MNPSVSFASLPTAPVRSSTPARLGIVGLGWPGLRHSEAVEATPSAQLYAVADLDAARREAYLATFKPEKVYGDFNEMLDDPNVDAVIVCLPNFFHYPASLAALRAGKHVMCEKPPTLNTEEMRELRTEAQRRGLVYAFGRQMRFNGRNRAAHEIVESGRLGEIYHARTGWIRSRGTPVGIGGWFLDKKRAGGGVIIDIGIHALDSAWYLMGCPRPLTMSASVSQQFRHLVPDATHFDVEDVGFAFIRFENGAAMQLEVCWAGNLTDEVPEVVRNGEAFRDRFYTELHGRRATLRLDPLTLFEDRGGKLVDVPLEAEAGNGFAEQLEDFLSAIRQGRVPTNSADQAFYLMEMLDAIYASSATGREVAIPESSAGL